MIITAEKLSATAAALLGFGFMPQSATAMPYRIPHPIVASESLIGTQSASSDWTSEIDEIRLLGEANYKRIQEISRLKYGWDGNKARPIPVSVINRTKDLLKLLPDGAKVFPTGRSTVQIEYHKDADNYFEIEISSKTYEIYSVMGDDEFEGNVLKKDIVNRVKLFLA